jgi:hypothetical protein
MTFKHSWTDQAIQACKQRIKLELDLEEASHGSEGRQRLLLARIKEHEEREDGEGLLALFIYLLSALLLQTRLNYLGRSRWERMLDLARSVLRSQGIREQSSRLAFLWGELHTIQSQLECQDGAHWSAAWQQFMGYYVTRGESGDEEALQQFSLGNRALRLGQTQSALNYFSTAAPRLDTVMQQRCWLMQLICFRLLGATDQAQQRVRELLLGDSLAPHMRLELEWEQMQLVFTETQDLSPFMSRCKKGGSHYASSYLAELTLLALTVKSRRWMDQVPRLENLRRRKNLDVQTRDLFFAMVQNLQDAYDSKRPLGLRLQQLGDDLAIAHKLLNVEKELLYWAAACRWLIRTRSEELRRLTQEEYRGKSLLLSGGRSTDILGVFRA